MARLENGKFSNVRSFKLSSWGYLGVYIKCSRKKNFVTSTKFWWVFEFVGVDLYTLSVFFL